MNKSNLQKSLALLVLSVIIVCTGMAASTPLNQIGKSQETKSTAKTESKSKQIVSQDKSESEASPSESVLNANIKFEFEQGGLHQVKVESKTFTQLGVHVSKTEKTLQKHLRMSPGTGLIVDHVIADSPATKKLNELDILVRLDDQLLINEEQLTTLVRNHKPGDQVEFTVIRDGEKKRVGVTLTESKQETKPLLFWEYHKAKDDSKSFTFSHEKHAKNMSCTACHSRASEFGGLFNPSSSRR